MAQAIWRLRPGHLLLACDQGCDQGSRRQMWPRPSYLRPTLRHQHQRLLRKRSGQCTESCCYLGSTSRIWTLLTKTWRSGRKKYKIIDEAVMDVCGSGLGWTHLPARPCSTWLSDSLVISSWSIKYDIWYDIISLMPLGGQSPEHWRASIVRLHCFGWF